MKIAYVTAYDSANVRNWSGSGYYIRKALEAQGNEILPIGNLKFERTWFYYPKAAFYKYIVHKNYHVRREPLVLKRLGDQVNEKLKDEEYDLVFCPGTSPISYLKKKKPIALWLDSTFASAIDFYPYYSNLAKETIEKANATTQLALDKADLIMFNSQWGADTTLANYNVNASKIKVVPFGANIEVNRTMEDVKKVVLNKQTNECNLLFVGVEWQRKGGDIAVKVAGELIKRGIPTTLHIVGVTPPAAVPDYCKVYGFISKHDENGRKFLEELFTNAHFFLLPTRAEMCAVVYAESASFGLPVITTDVGGVSTAIRNGKNGVMLPLDAAISDYCDVIESYFRSPEEYQKFSISSFEEYEKRMNWDVAGKTANDLIYKLLD